MRGLLGQRAEGSSTSHIAAWALNLLLSFHSLSVQGPYFLSLSKELVSSSCPAGSSLRQPNLGKPPAPRWSAWHLPSQMAWLQPPRVVATAASCVPTAAGILPDALGMASVDLWGPLQAFPAFRGTSNASKMVSSLWLGARGSRVPRVAHQL